MADPFEVRMRFTSLLSHLSASSTSSTKAAHYALKHRDMDEDLHSCILEQLERNTLNARANIMFFVETLCDLATREGYLEFVRMVERDILRIVDLVAPDDGSGAANVKVVRKVLGSLGQKGYLSAVTVGELEECVKDRDRGVEEEREGAQGKAHRAQGKVERKLVEQRIEEDRERHKRLRESIWAVDPEGDAEFDRLWDEVGGWEVDDGIGAREEARERRSMALFHRREMEDLAAS